MPSFVFNRSSRSLFGSLLRRKSGNTSSLRRRSSPVQRSSSAISSFRMPANTSVGNNSHNTSHFGLDIAELDPQASLPPPVSDLLFFLFNERKCLRNNEDIFQVRTTAIEVKQAAIIRAYNDGKNFRVDNIGVDRRDNVAAAFGAVIAYFQQMPRPLIPYAFMNFILSRDWYRIPPEDIAVLHDDFVNRLPFINYRILRKLIATLREMASWAFDRQNKEPPVWLSTFRRHWTCYSIHKSTNNAIYVSSFVSLSVFRSGLGKFAPDRESLFHFRGSCFLAQLILNYEKLFCPKRKNVTLPSSISKNSNDKCNRNEVGYESDQADLRLQQISALLTHLGKALELSNQMGTIDKDSIEAMVKESTTGVKSIRKRADLVALKLDSMGIGRRERLFETFPFFYLFFHSFKM